jgi:hypothetical protein
MSASELKPETKWSKTFEIDIAYHEHSGNFFINFSKDGKCYPSIKLTEAQANAYAREFGLKISK